MSAQRYERVSDRDDDGAPRISDDHDHQPMTPASPPPSFHSRASSPTAHHLLSAHDPLISDAERALADSFDSPSDDEDIHGVDDRRIHRGAEPSETTAQGGGSPPASEAGRRGVERRVTQLPIFPSSTSTASTPTASAAPGRGLSRPTNDGVFANLSAKPERGEKSEDQPPTYEQAAADATPPYWETTILAPGVGSNEVFIDGLPVGSVFSFAWNGLIAMSFQFVGFLLTYLLHTTHAAKNGSKAGLGILLVKWGLEMKSTSSNGVDPGEVGQPPQDPNGHDFGPSGSGAAMVDGQDGSNGGAGSGWGLTNNDILAYGIMIIGWFILIRSVGQFLRARRHEQLVLQSPDRGLGVPIIATGERAEAVV